ncbi:DUF4279 domain-containing protein [Marinobacter sp. F3R11]|uniref:DUF4279 domain-containing protein n=1 Tax=Marinobacter sp. F3R11 TaxID=2267231 RepID=UPI000DEAB84F|nr:DUF4279 domain-containing protein [Marinobacter sp. F3R11]RBW52093.1 hypothetical protein DS878_01830 [Marinobacter sp. F3R11]
MRFVKIGVRLWGEELQPDKITEILGLQPTQTQLKGDVKKLSGGNLSAPRELGMWCHTREVSSNLELELKALLDSMEARNLKEIDGVEHAIVDIFVGLSDEDYYVQESFEYRFENNILETIFSMGLDIRTTIT